MIRFLTTPLGWIVVLLVAGLPLMRFSRKKIAARIGWSLVLLGVVMLFVMSLPPFANMLTYSLESRVPVPTAEAIATLDILVVLGGGGNPSGGFRAEAELSGAAYPRFYHGVRLFLEGHGTVLAFCGGPMPRGLETEAETMGRMAVRLGVPEHAIVTETTSRNTMQNATHLVDLLPAGQGRRIGLVTSATHMLRSSRVFAECFPNDTIVPIPVDHQYDPHPWSIGNLKPSVSALRKTTMAVHEWIGLLWYALRY